MEELGRTRAVRWGRTEGLDLLDDENRKGTVRERRCGNCPGLYTGTGGNGNAERGQSSRSLTVDNCPVVLSLALGLRGRRLPVIGDRRSPPTVAAALSL